MLSPLNRIFASRISARTASLSVVACCSAMARSRCRSSSVILSSNRFRCWSITIPPFSVLNKESPRLALRLKRGSVALIFDCAHAPAGRSQYPAMQGPSTDSRTNCLRAPPDHNQFLRRAYCAGPATGPQRVTGHLSDCRLFAGRWSYMSKAHEYCSESPDDTQGGVWLLLVH